MEGTPLFDKLNRLMRPSPLESLTQGTEEIRVIIHNSGAPEEVTVTGLAPFHTIEDLQRALWLQQGKQEDLFPKYTFLGLEDEDGLQNATGTWMNESGDKPIILPDPERTIRGSILQDDFVDTDGNKKPVRFSARGRVTLGEAFSPSEKTPLPVFHCYTLQYLLRQYRGTAGAMPARDWYGLFYPYFPAVNQQAEYSFSEEDTKFAASVETYISAKLSQTAVLSDLLGTVSLKELKTVGTKYMSLIWTEPTDFDGADVLFYTAPVNEQRPYMRLLTPNTTPITKLYQPESIGLPLVHDVTLLKTWTEDTTPIADKSVLYIKALVRKEQVGAPPLFGTYIISDDGTANFILQPPKDIRQIDVQHDLGQLGKLLYDTAVDLPIHLQEAKLFRAQLTIHLEFDEVPPKDIRRKVAERFEQLGTLFQPASVPKGMQKPLFMFRFKGVSNFVQEDKIAAYLTFFFSRKGLPTDDAMQFYAEHLADEFELSVDEAIGYIKTYLTKRAELTIADPDAKEFLPVENAGIEIAITSENVTTFNFQLLNVDSFEHVQLICTVLSLVFYGTQEEWDEVLQLHKLVAPAKAAKAEEAVAKESLEEEAEEREGTLPGVGLAQPDLVLDDFEGFGDEEEVVAPAPVPALAPSEPKKGKEALKVKEEGEQAIIPYEWYISRLKKLDNRLFEYKVTTGTRHWTSQCATNDDRQPAILSQAQYLNMRSIYEEDEAENKIGFIVYGVPNTLETIQDAKGKHLQITVLRYGSDASAPNYYLCAEYFCLRDLLPLIPEEFKGTKDRNGEPKAANSCPFCGGTLFGDSPNDRKHPLPGQTVHRRRVKQQSSKKHLYINFLKNPAHPLGFDMPCCFVSRKDVAWADERFRRLRDVSPKTSAAAVAEAEAEREEEEKASVRNSLLIRVQQLVNYDQLRYKIHREYVVGPEKFPLEPGKIGMPNLALDTYLGQDSASMVVRSAVRQEFKPDVHGFFRLGVFNRTIQNNQSLFAALAPCLGMNTTAEVERYFLNLIKVNIRLFLHLNFGNLLLDFFDPEYEVDADEEAEFTKLATQLNVEGSELELERLKKSYSKFKKYIIDPSQKKQLKYFAHLLAELGLTVLTITYKGNPRDPATDVEVSCPLLGLDMDRYNNNKLAFLTYHPPSGIWEPLMYIDQIIEKDTAPIQQEAFYSISQEMLQATDFPPIVLQRYKEFRTQCRSAFRGAFTLQRGIDSRELIPLTQMIQLIKPFKIEGIVRDSSNHLVAITVRAMSTVQQEVLIPVADDGNPLFNVSDIQLHLGLQSIEYAVPIDVEDVYTTLAPKLQPLSKLYTLNGFLTTDQVIGFRLGVPGVTQLINLPCLPYESEGVTKGLIPLEQADWFRFEYELNRAISFGAFPETGEETKPVEAYTDTPYLLGRELAEQIYQHLRLSFSNWIAKTEQRSRVRQFVDRLLYREKTIPIYEKMRRLEIELGSTIQSWFAPDSYETFAIEPVVFRADCIDQSEDKCDGFCAVKDGQCRIHTPNQVVVGYTAQRKERRVEAVRYFMLRLFDEILRIPARRAELLNQGVRKIQVPSRNVHIGTEWILPETSAAWYTLLRDDNQRSMWEKPTRYEEFSRQTESEEEKRARLAVLDVQELPAEVDAYISPEGKGKLALRLVGTADSSRVDTLLEQFSAQRAAVDTSTDAFGAATLGALADKVKVSVVQVLVLQPDTPPLARAPSNADAKPGLILLVPDAPEGPGYVMDIETNSYVIPMDWILPELTRELKHERKAKVLLKAKPKPNAAAALPKPNAAAPARPKPSLLTRQRKVVRPPPEPPAAAE
jgi:hypothetical protein